MRNVFGQNIKSLFCLLLMFLLSSCKIGDNEIKGAISGVDGGLPSSEIPLPEVPDNFVLSPPSNLSLEIKNFKIDNSAVINFNQSPFADLTEAQIHLASDNSIVEPWKVVTPGTMIASSLLQRGKKYYFKLRSKKGSSSVSSEVTSSTWTAISDLPCTDSRVSSTTVYNNKLYMGGWFTKIAPCSGGGIWFNGATGNYLSDINQQVKISGQVWVTISDGAGGQFIGGVFESVDKNLKYNLAHITSSGEVTSWSPNFNGKVSALATDGTYLYVGGQFTQVNGQSKPYLVSFNMSDGSLTSWNPNPNNPVTLLNYAAGKLYVGGTFWTIGGGGRGYLCSFDTSDGSLTAWAPEPNNIPTAFTNDGTYLFVAGVFSTIASVSRTFLASFNLSDGSITGFNPLLNNRPETMVVVGNDLIIGGVFSYVVSTTRNYLASIDKVTGSLNSWNPNVGNHVYSLAVDSNHLYVGGAFTTVAGGGGTQTRLRLASYLLSDFSLTSWNPDPSGNVRSIYVETGDKVFIGGEYTFFDSGSTARNYLASIDLSTNQVTSWNPNPNNYVDVLKVDEGKLYVAGSYTNIAATARNRLVTFDLTDDSLTSWNPNVNNSIWVIHFDNTHIYIGGLFSTVSSLPRGKVASFAKSDGNITSWNPSFDNDVFAIATNDTSIFVGGAFNQINAVPFRFLGQFNKSDGLQTTWQPDPNAAIRKMYFSGTKLFLSGSFTQVGGVNTNSNVVAIDESTGLMTGWNPQITGGIAHDILEVNGTMYFGGEFNSASGTTRKKLVAFDSTTGALLDWNPQIESTGYVTSLTHYQGLIYANGSFKGHGGMWGPHGANISGFHLNEGL